MELFQIEQEVKDFVHNQPNLTSNEKVKRIQKTLSFIGEIYLKHQEEVPVVEAYNMLYTEESTNE